MIWLRLTLLGTTLGFFFAAVIEHPSPMVMALGVVPIAWIFVEAVWYLSAEPKRDQDES